jgi:intracellular septation protein A
MKKIVFLMASVFTFLSVLFAILPLGTLALIPIGIALIFGLLALKKSEANQTKWIKIVLVITVLSLVFVIGKEVFTKDEVQVDQQFNATKEASKQEAQKELEELE